MVWSVRVFAAAILDDVQRRRAQFEPPTPNAPDFPAVRGKRQPAYCPRIFPPSGNLASRTDRLRNGFRGKTLIAPYGGAPYSSAGPQNSAVRQAGADPKVEVLVCFRVGSEGSGKQRRPDAVRSRQPRAWTMVRPGFQPPPDDSVIRQRCRACRGIKFAVIPKVDAGQLRPAITILQSQTRRCGDRATGVSCRQEGSPWALFGFNCRII